MPGEEAYPQLLLNESLRIGELKNLCYALKQGMLCVVPSDTAYALAANPFRADAIAQLKALRGGPADEPIPLSFASVNMMERYVRLRAEDHREIEKFCPGPLMLVCKPLQEAAPADPLSLDHILGGRGQLGVRISSSVVERQISEHLQQPITTCAIRDPDGKHLTKFDDAMDVLKERKKTLPSRGLHLFGIRMNIRYSDVSTVVSVQPEIAKGRIKVFREGVVSPKEIQEVLDRLGFSDVEDWT